MDPFAPTPQPISAADAIAPAFNDTGRILFKPFRWGRWWRMGILALATGELASGFSCNFNVPAHIPQQTSTGQQFLAAGGRLPDVFNKLGLDPAMIATLITVLVLGFFVLAFVHAYVSSVLRFVLFEAVAEERFALIEGWKRRHPQGLQFFLFLIVFGLMFLAGIAVLLGFPLVLSIHAKAAGGAAPILAWLLAIPLLLVFVLVWMLVFVFTKDFAVPIMALEKISVAAAMRRVWSMVRSAPGSYAGYAGMKLVLAIAAAIGFSIVQVVVLLILLIPVVVVAVGVGLTAPAFYKDPTMLAALITCAVLLLFFMFYVLAVIGSPVTVFFQSYAYEFFGSRYLPLWQVMHPAPPPPPPPPPILPTAPEGTAPAM